MNEVDWFVKFLVELTIFIWGLWLLVAVVKCANRLKEIKELLVFLANDRPKERVDSGELARTLSKPIGLGGR